MDARRRRRATRRASCGLRPPQLPHRQQPSSRRPARTHARRAPGTGGGSREGARRGEVSRPWRPEASRWAEVEAGRARAPPSSREGVVCAAAVEATPNRPGRRAMALLAGGGRGRVPPPQRASTAAPTVTSRLLKPSRGHGQGGAEAGLCALAGRCSAPDPAACHGRKGGGAGRAPLQIRRRRGWAEREGGG